MQVVIVGPGQVFAFERVVTGERHRAPQKSAPGVVVDRVVDVRESAVGVVTSREHQPKLIVDADLKSALEMIGWIEVAEQVSEVTRVDDDQTVVVEPADHPVDGREHWRPVSRRVGADDIDRVRVLAVVLVVGTGVVAGDDLPSGPRSCGDRHAALGANWLIR